MTRPKILLAKRRGSVQSNCVQLVKCRRCKHKLLDSQDHPPFGRLDTCLKRCDASSRTLGNLPRVEQSSRGSFRVTVWTIAPTVALGAELDGCCPETRQHSARKTTQRLEAGALSGRSGNVSRATGAAARAGVASRREAATTVGMSLSGTGLQADRSPASNGNLIRAKARCLGTTRIPQFIRLAPELNTAPSEMGELCPFPAVVLDYRLLASNNT